METDKNIREEALLFLKEKNTGVLATAFDGDVQAATVYYVVDNDFNFYIVTKRNTEKYKNALLFPQVAFVVGTGPEYITVQMKGTIELVKDEEIEKTLENFKKISTSHPPKDWPIQVAEELKEKTPVLFKITPSELTFMNLDSEKYPASIGPKHHKII